ncbi:4'-phosphopantetheinyl transferase family protein [Colwellia psychrerythraea]|uniref:Enterobactin synthase component D n=1 Tax=Colwellia psychrerythraea TaxID=28229 RepID=A0A099K7N8_COLPS|nr:4'-phosphopantetheinyl transferase superfamily protein [Colwellia psychrerythraea]KGJ86794.1 4'-phosphopantetheinyl transferase [Colwellia psychrerythraea]
MNQANLNLVNKASFISVNDDPSIFLPKHILLTSCDYQLSLLNTQQYQKLNVALPESIKKSVIKRQAEYLAGRYAGILCLEKLGFKNTQIPIGKHRSPVWPCNVVGSITHTNTRAMSAVAWKKNCSYLGIDHENILTLECISEIKRSIINIKEEILLSEICKNKTNNLDFESVFTLIFSVKESLFKALYPSVGFYFDFSVAEVINICCKKESVSIILLQDLTYEFKKGKVLTGKFHFDKSSVFTIIIQQ